MAATVVAAIRPDRIGVIGASQVAAALGLNPHCTPEEVRQDILSGRWDGPSGDPDDPCYLGLVFEPQVLHLLERWLIKHGFGHEGQVEVIPWDLTPEGVCRADRKRPSLVHPDFTWLRATPDAVCRLRSMTALAQSKVPFRGKVGDGPEEWGDADESLSLLDFSRWGCPRYYAIQTMVELGVARDCGWPVEWNFIPALGLPRRTFDVWPVEFSEEAWNDILERLVPWYYRHIEGDEPCPPVTWGDAIRRWPRAGNKIVSVDAATEQLFRERADLATELKQAKGQLERLDVQLLERIGEATVIFGPNGKIGRWTRAGFRPDEQWRKAV